VLFPNSPLEPYLFLLTEEARLKSDQTRKTLRFEQGPVKIEAQMNSSPLQIVSVVKKYRKLQKNAHISQLMKYAG